MDDLIVISIGFSQVIMNTPEYRIGQRKGKGSV